METMTEPGVLPLPHHNSHPYLRGPGGSNTGSVNPGFFQGSDMENASSATSPPQPPSASNEENQQSYSSFPTASSQGFPPYTYKQQFQQNPTSLHQSQDSAPPKPADPYLPQRSGQHYPTDAGAMDYPAVYMNAKDAFGRNPESRPFGYPRSSSNLPPFHGSQPAGMIPGFRSQHHPSPGATRNRSGTGEGDSDENHANSRPNPQSPFVPETPGGYMDQERPGMSARQGYFPPPGKEQEMRGSRGKDSGHDANFVPPGYYDKAAGGYPAYGPAYNGNKSFGDGGECGSVYGPKKQPAFLESFMGNFRSASGDTEAEAIACDNEKFSSGGRLGLPPRDVGMKNNREPLERSASHDVQSVAWGSELNLEREERDADGRPLRSLTLDPSLHRRYSKPEAFTNNYSDREENNYPRASNARPGFHQQDLVASSDRANPHRKLQHQPNEKSQGGGLMMSPVKPTRRLSDSGLRDAESAAIPQQSPNRPGLPSAYSEKLQQATVSPGLYQKDDKPGEESAPGDPLSTDSPGSETDLPKFTSPRLGEQLNRTGSETHSDPHRDEDEDDIDGDPKLARSETSADGDEKRPLSHSQSKETEGTNNNNNNNDSSDSAPYYNIGTNGAAMSNTGKDGVPRDDSEGFTAKRELFSEDEEEEDSQDAGSRRGHYPSGSSPRSMSPPSPDSSMTYPSHYPHPFFSSTRGGMNTSIPFGSSRGGGGGPEPGPGFPFGKDFSGRFPMSGMGGAPEMGMGGLPRMGPGSQRGHGSHHRFMNPMGMMEDENKDIYFCHLCSYSGKTKSDFDSHMSIHFEFNCPHCDYTSRTEGRLKRHIKDFHSDDSSRRSMPGRPKIYRCKQCPFSAKEKDKFWEHARSHIKEDKLLQCPKCSFVTEYKHHLEYHLRNHFGSKPFKCTKCNYSCVNKSMLNSHMKSHTNVYQYRCSECTYATKYCHSLKLHLKKYGHKPATVLNQDGSLPQGLDVDASGLSVATKRGPPRGPRGPRKDKTGAAGGAGGDPYMSQLFGMPPVPMGVPGMGPHTMNAINPMLNGMMPFWPMLPHGPGGMGGGHAQGPHHHTPPSQAAMLPGMGSLAHQMRLGGPDAGMLHHHRMDHEPTRPSAYTSPTMGKGMMNRGRPHSRDSEERNAMLMAEEGNRRVSAMMMSRGDGGKHDYAACNLCDFIADDTRALCMHYVDVHKEESGRDIRRDFGMMPGNVEEWRAGFSFSGEEELARGRKMAEMDKRRMSEPPIDAGSENGYQEEEIHRRNSLAGNPGMLRRKNNGNEANEGGVTVPWQTASAFPEREQSKRMDMCYPSLKDTPEEGDSSGERSGKDGKGMNILHQMTLKFGSGAPMEREGAARDERSAHEDFSGGKRGEDGGSLTKPHSDRPETGVRRQGRAHKETPLDLTKPKSDSPSDFDNSNSPEDYGEEFGTSRDFASDNAGEAKEEAGKSLSKVTEILLKKRPYPEEFPEVSSKSLEPSSADKGSAIMPRKRSRKGKAYKLDTICLKLQEQRTSSPLDSDGNESDMEMGFSGFQPLFSTPNSADVRGENENGEKKESGETTIPTPDEPEGGGDLNKDVELPVVRDNDGMDSDGTEDYTNEEKNNDDFDDFKEVGEMTRVISREGVAVQTLQSEKTSEEIEKDLDTREDLSESDHTEYRENSVGEIAASDMKKSKTVDESEDVEETDFEKLQRTLKMLNSGEEATDTQLDSEKAEVGKGDIEEEKEATKMNENGPIKTVDPSSPRMSDTSASNLTKTEECEMPKSPQHQHSSISECHSDKENSDGQAITDFNDPDVGRRPMSPEELGQPRLDQCSFDSEEEIDQVDLIHTVLENRKKPLPPAVRRGTELAWKLLNDPVNPVTSIPIPVVTGTSSTSESGSSRERAQSGSPTLLPPSSCPTSRPRPGSPPPPLPVSNIPAHPASQTTPMSPRPVTGPAPSSPHHLRNGMRQQDQGYRQLHPYPHHQPPTANHHALHNHYQHPHPPPPPPPSLHRSNHPLFHPPQYGPLPSMSSSSGSPTMKPSPLSSSSSMPIPLPPTPMAFIPPTNRMDRVPDSAHSPGVASHAKQQHPAGQQQKSELYECTYCDLTFRDCVMYTVHMGYHSNRNPFKCNSCGIICRDKVEFFLHIARSPHA